MARRFHPNTDLGRCSARPVWSYFRNLAAVIFFCCSGKVLRHRGEIGWKEHRSGVRRRGGQWQAL